ncbi:DUF4913 domain-containing protein [Arthrobacter sp. NPDC092385]|uniref:DUF4913 domain-containing protein n=1 Tax=Arthrobacter sp. NPDC092385 TaxID=3363943 RepID=UPI00380F80CC
MTEPDNNENEPITISWAEGEGGPDHPDAWDQEPTPEVLVDAVTGMPATPDTQTGTEARTEPITTPGVPFQFALTATEVSALVSERVRKLSPIGFKALVSAGEAPQPSTIDGKTPLWFLDEVELWIQDRYVDAVESAPADDSDRFASFLSEDDAEPAAEKESDGPAEEPELVYGSVAQWVQEFLIPVYRRVLSANGSNSTWCPSWWMHAEAVIRLEALWRAWEHLRLDGKTGMSVFMKDHLDHHMAVLTDTKGPFDGCTLDRGHDAEALKPFPIVAPPVELFPDVREETDSSQASPNEGE